MGQLEAPIQRQWATPSRRLLRLGLGSTASARKPQRRRRSDASAKSAPFARLRPEDPQVVLDIDGARGYKRLRTSDIGNRLQRLLSRLRKRTIVFGPAL